MTVHERKKRERESRRESIVDAAEKTIQVKGFDGMTMDDVAVIAELGKGTIYLYFKSKIDLYHAVVCRGLRLLKGQLEKAIDKRSAGIENLIALGRAYYQFSLSHLLYFNAMMHNEAFNVDWDQQLQCEGVKGCQEASNQIFTLVAEVIHKGIVDGSIRSDLPPIKLSILLWAQTTGILQMTAAKSEFFEKEMGVASKELLEFDLELTRRAIAPPPGKGAKK